MRHNDYLQKDTLQTDSLSFVSSLNTQQRKAVLFGNGPLLVLAGAGSGKTRVIICRIARLIYDGIQPSRILGVTFTNKAANEMRERLKGMIGKQAKDVHLSTFHSLGLRIIQEEMHRVGLTKGFCIYDTSDQMSLVRDLMRQIKVADRRLDVGRVLDIILKTKRERLSEVALDWGDDYELAAYELYPRYRAQMKAFNAIDFDDLILLSQDLLRHPEVAEKWSNYFDYLLVDEYQDTSPDQLEMIQILASKHHNICAVGDDDQAIYAWRGAAVDNILSFSRHFPNTTEIILDQNYRSTSAILDAANHVISKNLKRKPKKLWSDGGLGDPVDIIKCADAEDEAQCVIDYIERLKFEKVALKDIAVLYRSNMQSRTFEEALIASQIRYRIVGGQAFFDRKEVRDTLAFLTLAVNSKDEVALRRIINVPARGIGHASLERLAEYAKTHHKTLYQALQDAAFISNLPASALEGAHQLVRIVEHFRPMFQKAKGENLVDAVKQYLQALDLRNAVLAADDPPSVLEKRLENLDEMVNAVSRFAHHHQESDFPLLEFVHKASLIRQKEEDEEGNEHQITLMTFHSAKGLEFNYVFMVGVEEDILPHKKTVDTGADLSEERRLCYVGMTRARKKLYMLYAATRSKNGRIAECSPSRFLSDIPSDIAIRKIDRNAVATGEESEKLAQAFFQRMREQLGITDDE